MFYAKFIHLCEQRGVSPSKAAIDAGISKSLVTKWKLNQTKEPSPEVLRKLATYFNLTVSDLLDEKTPTQVGERQVSDDDIKFALFGGDGEITDAMYDEVKRFAKMVKLREEAEKKKE